MSICRVFQYAYTQARVLARIGDMPDNTQWRHISEARDLDTLIARMRENKLQYWIKDLPREPGTNSIELHLRTRLVAFFGELEMLLPGRWSNARCWLREGAELVSVDQPHLWMNWWDGLPGVFPRMHHRELAAISRVHTLAVQHLHRIHSASSETAGDLDLQWQWRNELTVKLRASLAGDPFHAGLVMVYALLQAMQFERSRALLLSLSRGWEPPDLLRGAD